MPLLPGPFQAKSTSIRQSYDSPAGPPDAKFGIVIHSGSTLYPAHRNELALLTTTEGILRSP